MTPRNVVLVGALLWLGVLAFAAWQTESARPRPALPADHRTVAIERH